LISEIVNVLYGKTKRLIPGIPLSELGLRARAQHSGQERSRESDATEYFDETAPESRPERGIAALPPPRPQNLSARVSARTSRKRRQCTCTTGRMGGEQKSRKRGRQSKCAGRWCRQLGLQERKLAAGGNNRNDRCNGAIGTLLAWACSTV